MEAAYSSKTPADFYQRARRYIPEDSTRLWGNQMQIISYVSRPSRDPTLFADSRSHCARVYDLCNKQRESFHSHVWLVYCRTGLCPCKQHLRGRKIPISLQTVFFFASRICFVFTDIIFQFYYTFVPVYLLILIITNLHTILIVDGLRICDWSFASEVLLKPVVAITNCCQQQHWHYKVPFS
jgi:hypothetical protein